MELSPRKTIVIYLFFSCNWVWGNTWRYSEYSTSQQQQQTDSTNQPKTQSFELDTSTAKNKKRAASFVPSRKTNRPWLAYVEGQGDVLHSLSKSWEAAIWSVYVEQNTCHASKARKHKKLWELRCAQGCCSSVSPCSTMRDNPWNCTTRCLSKFNGQTFACLYFLCKNRIAHTINFGPLLDLIGFLGVNLK